MAGVEDVEGLRGDRFAARLAAGDVVESPVALVVAHPDDETLWAGSALARMADLRLIHVTDGAPHDMADAQRLGFSQRETYAAARAGELDQALDALGSRPERCGYRVPDQEAVFHLREMVDRLERDLADREAVITHPYEGGHPDHDAIALAVRAAVDRLARRGAAPALVEFACYHRLGGERVFGRFWPDARCPERRRPITVAERGRLDAAIAAHASQEAVIAGWQPQAERWRGAPRYDFAVAPPPGTSLYDGFGWALTSERWRQVAAEAIEEAVPCA